MTYKDFLNQDGEKRWQDKWLKEKIDKAEDFGSKPKKYVLDMFPYPSGAGLHVGHPEGYTATDVYSRYFRLKGFNVLHPMGWDAYGLPAENYAIKTGTQPNVTTAENVATFKRQIQSLGFSYDWDREINTTDPGYYKWTQWIFLQLFKKGLAYEATVPINFCPSCKTGLANEEVKDGKCDRCGTEVIKKDMRQWMLKITAYADRLLEGVDKLDWPNSIKTLQKNWIGRSEGAEVTFAITTANVIPSEAEGSLKIKVYTTRPDTLFGATYMVLSPEHKLVQELKDKISNFSEVEKYISDAKNKSDLERTELNKNKTGVELKGIKAINPVNNVEIPIWISDYVLSTYGTGAIMAVPAHDDRDFEFAKKFDLPIIEVIKGGDIKKEAYTDVDNGLMVNSEFLNGLMPEEAIGKMTAWLEEKKVGKKAINYKLRDWVFSRQRYWGEPIPLVHCDKCGIVPLDEKDLPLTLPEVKKYEPTGTGESPLATIDIWVNTTCPKCGGPAKRETNTMPQWAGSSWYWLRYIDPYNHENLADPKKLKYWLPVDLYLGGAEHAVLHLLYARFWNMVLFDLGAVPFEEPFTKLINQGLILGEDNEKMSKSRGNVVNPDDIVKEYGADTFRLYEMFMGPLEDMKPWSTKNILGVNRFLFKVWEIGQNKKEELRFKNEEIEIILNKTIKKVGEDIEKMSYNTAISAMMVLANEINKHVSETGHAPSLQNVEKFLIILSSFAPHLTEELWAGLGHKTSIFKEAWPEYDESKTIDSEIELPVQVNGKVRAKLKVATDISEADAVALAKADENIKKYLISEPKKVIFIKGKMISFVI
ncbi:MAG: leucine--tRNA ligase [bacterium]